MATQKRQDRRDSPDRFLDPGIQYYVAGRFAFLQRCTIAANLFHHSVELLLKFDLRKPPYTHDLTRLWDDFKNRNPSRLALSLFDAVVADLHAWEQLRYPGFLTSEVSGQGIGQALSFQPQRASPNSVASDREVEKYVLCLEDVDELVSAILVAAPINPAALLLPLAPEAVDWYLRDNRHSLAGVKPRHET